MTFKTWSTSTLFLFLLFGVSAVVAQENSPTAPTSKIWELSRHESAASFRGLHVLDDASHIWVSGTKGTILHSVDGGKSWKDVSPKGADGLDFRDVHGFKNGHAVAMAVGSPAKIYRTKDGGQSWKVVFQDDRPDIFLDAMSFQDDKHGIAFGDPIDGKLVVLNTDDGGRSWAAVESAPGALSGEGGFAASGTCLCLQGEKVFIGLGGQRSEGDPAGSRILISGDQGRSWQSVVTPLKSAAASGIFSIAFLDDQNGVAVGGTYDNPQDRTSHIANTADGGKTWTRPASTPRGYRSCVTIQNSAAESGGPRILALGKTGGDYSDDLGKTWKTLDDTGFYAADSNSRGSVVVAVGPKGTIGVLK